MRIEWHCFVVLLLVLCCVIRMIGYVSVVLGVSGLLA